MKRAIKAHFDISTVPTVITEIMDEYAKEGYQVERLTPMNFKIILDDGWAHIFWEKGCIYEEYYDNTGKRL